MFNAENKGDHVHALRGHPGWGAETRSTGTGGQRHAGHHDHHEGRLPREVPECFAADHCQISKSDKCIINLQNTGSHGGVVVSAFTLQLEEQECFLFVVVFLYECIDE